MLYKYPVFNEQAWKYNVDRFFFLFFLSLVINTILYTQVRPNASSILVLFRMLFGWTDVLFIIALIEALLATTTKIALNPNCLIDSKLTVYMLC